MKLLSKEEYLATMGTPMRLVDQGDCPPFDFWTYFEAIPTKDSDGHDFSAGEVNHAWTDPTGQYQHVLINCEDKNIFMVLVLDLQAQAVFGHRLLDLNLEYGLGDRQD